MRGYVPVPHQTVAHVNYDEMEDEFSRRGEAKIYNSEDERHSENS